MANHNIQIKGSCRILIEMICDYKFCGAAEMIWAPDLIQHFFFHTYLHYYLQGMWISYHIIEEAREKQVSCNTTANASRASATVQTHTKEP